MNTLETIKTRKSVRNYLDKPVEEDKIEAIAKAGNMAAHSPMVGEIYFNVITKPEVLKAIADGAKNVMKKSGVKSLEDIAALDEFSPLHHAPVAIIISSEQGQEPYMEGMAHASAACAGQNITLAATELGLASCYTESPALAFTDPEVCKAAGITEKMKPQVVVVFGYSDDNTPHAERPENPENIVYVK